MNLKVTPISRQGIVSVPGMIVWCGTMVRTPDGRCHLMLSLWPEDTGFDGWISNSQIGYAVAENLETEYEFKGIVLTGSGKPDSWDRDMVHNPWIIYHDRKFYMYYTGNYGDGTFEYHRFTQRVGLAVSDKPAGPWIRLEQPLPQSQPGSWDELVSCNPSVCQMADGRFIMLYRACSNKDNPHHHGDIVLGAAFADKPEGPFIRHSEPIFRREGEPFAAEDPGVFLWNNKLYAVFKDMGSWYNLESSRSLMLAESMNGKDWEIGKPLTTRSLQFVNNGLVEHFRVERPFIYMENNIPKQLFVAVKPRDEIDHTFNVHTNIEVNQEPEVMS